MRMVESDGMYDIRVARRWGLVLNDAVSSDIISTTHSSIIEVLNDMIVLKYRHVSIIQGWRCASPNQQTPTLFRPTLSTNQTAE